MVVGTAFTGLAATAAASEDVRALTEESRKVANTLLQQIRGELVKAIDSSGPLKAIVVCKYSVPEISSAVSRKTGWKVSRVALGPRNPVLGGADAWEQKVLMGFEQRVARGEKADAMEFAEIVSEPQGRSFRYMKALPLAPMCMNCHGPDGGLSDAVKARLGSEYPHDRATGQKLGDVRGAVTIKRRLD